MRIFYKVFYRFQFIEYRCLKFMKFYLKAPRLGRVGPRFFPGFSTLKE